MERSSEVRFRGEPALELVVGDLTATFLPALGMTGVSLTYRGQEHLALPGGLDALRKGSTLGLPLLAPWANRLAARRYEAAGVEVDLAGLSLRSDSNGLPIHGLLVGQHGWQVVRNAAGGGQACFAAAIDVDAPAFPFAHRIEVTVIAREDELTIDTRVFATGSRQVPIAFGWHPYLQLPGSSRSDWQLRLPSRTHLELDERGIPTGQEHDEPREADAIGDRTFDDLYRLASDHELSLVNDEASITMRAGDGYRYAQVWVPPDRPFAALEPMTDRTNSLVDGTPPLVEPGDSFTATYTLAVGGPP
jgi:aldose 1-epimerase